jgi:subtilisin family serine protease
MITYPKLQLSPQRAKHRLLLTLSLGETPEHLPTQRECRRGEAKPSRIIDGGAIDRLLRHYGCEPRTAHLHGPSQPGRRRYDDIEQRSGVARVLRVEVSDDSRMGALVDSLRQLPVVDRVMTDYLAVAPFDVAPAAASGINWEEAWAVRKYIRLPEALGYEPGDPAVVIGLADTGVNGSHGEFEQRIRHGFDTVDLRAEDVSGYTLVGDESGPDEDSSDEVGHGTGCAGILVARGNELPPGVAGGCGLVPGRVLGAAIAVTGKRVGIGAIANIDQGMKRLIDLGVKVINMSFGTPESALTPDDQRPHIEIVNYALSRGCILVAASGNSGETENFFPAADPDVIAVGAVDGSGVPASFMTRGEHVALCAPGTSIWTCGLNGYTKASGTSFAAPFVAGIVALLVARANRRAFPLNGALVRQILVESVRPFGAVDRVGCGAGIVDALAALQLLDRKIDNWTGDET